MRRLVRLKTVSSTQSAARRLAEQGAPAGTLVWALEQTAGRGRMGRRWRSRTGGLYVSWLLRPKFAPARLADFSLACGAAAAAALHEAAGIETSVKPPNDVLALCADGKLRKVCGILTETMFAQRITAIVGIGLNLNQRDFPKEISGRATSLFLATGRKEDARGFASLILESFIPYYAHFEKGDHKKILDEWKKNCSTLGKNITIIEQSRTFSAKAVGVNSEGMLRVRTKGGKMRTLLDAQISVR
ncbi:MAG: biotin--[acetyl-CoA-carboxylase] ligase [Elusimicrobia bacterium GWA2_66_18]|nr:MAG: biotin--[acetyl-CoA-carboxylase] ligase [Elusimicrobia bacterium GWA2_66_18]